MNVIIYKKEDGSTVASIPVIAGGLDYTPSESMYFNLAWKSAVDDGLVKFECRDQYSFKLSK